MLKKREGKKDFMQLYCFLRATVYPIGLFLAVVILSGCATSKHILRGDKLMRKRSFTEAISAYEKALVENSDDLRAQKGIRDARRQSVRDVLRAADAKFARDDFSQALLLAARARRMPLDLDAVQVGDHIDRTVRKAVEAAEHTVTRWAEAGLYVPAVELSDAMVKASPGRPGGKKWRDKVRNEAKDHFKKLAAELEIQKMSGSAAMQMAIAKGLGEPIEVAKVSQLWDNFVTPICFAEPNIKMTGIDFKEDVATAVLNKSIEVQLTNTLNRLRDTCGNGTRALVVNVQFTDSKVVDNTETVTAAKSLPGFTVVTEEEYFEEIPFTVMENVVEEQVHMEQVRKRDCSPRPGRSRGCHEWTEEIEIKTAVTVKKEVTKIKRVKHTRPAKGPFPEGQVVTYPVTMVDRSILIRGTLQVVGGADKIPFKISKRSQDHFHDQVKHSKLTIDADIDQSKSINLLAHEIAVTLADKLDQSLSQSVQKWSSNIAAKAREKERAGRLPEAEELYLQMIALGVVGDKNVDSFFNSRYGRLFGDLLPWLQEAMGASSTSATSTGKQGDNSVAAVRFPRHDNTVSTESIKSAAEIADEALRAERATKVSKERTAAKALQAREEVDITSMEEDEMAALEAASMGDEGDVASGQAVETTEKIEDPTLAE